MLPRYTFPIFALALCVPATMHAQQVQKCCGTSNSTFLLGNTNFAPHTQSLYLPADLTNAENGSITELYFRYGTTGDTIGNTLDSLLIRLGQTMDIGFVGDNEFFTDLDTALFAAEYTIPPGIEGEWFSIPLQTPFPFVTDRTLILDIWFTGSLTTNFGTLGNGNNGRKLYALTLDDATGATSSSTWQDIGFDVLDVSSINEHALGGLELFNMPGGDQLRVVRKGSDLANASILLLDASGRQLDVRRFPQGNSAITIDLGGLATGVYLIELIQADGEVITRRFHHAR